MGAYALATPSLDFAARLGLPAAADAALRPLSAILLFYALIAGLERALPYRPEWNRSHGDVRTDVLHLVFTGQGAQGLFLALAAGPLIALSAAVAAASGAPLWPSGWPLLAQLGLALVLGELGHYAFHRLSHENRFVWRLHAAHHSASSPLSREGNTNYGAVLNLWDHAFRSFHRPDAPFAGPVGIGQLPAFPGGWLAQQLAPFRWGRIRAGSAADPA